VSITPSCWVKSLADYVCRDEGAFALYTEAWPPRAANSAANRPTARRALVDSSQQALLRAHADTICALASIDTPFRGGLISGDRAGVIKVWRIEGADQ
jgi:phosphoinositide-3-kinase regulatory subunit 4